MVVLVLFVMKTLNLLGICLKTCTHDGIATNL